MYNIWISVRLLKKCLVVFGIKGVEEKGEPLGFINIHSITKYQKTRRGPFGNITKISKKKSNSAEKNPEGERFRHVRFCRFP